MRKDNNKKAFIAVAKSLKEFIHGGPLGLHKGSKNNKHQIWQPHDPDITK